MCVYKLDSNSLPLYILYCCNVRIEKMYRVNMLTHLKMLTDNLNKCFNFYTFTCITQKRKKIYIYNTTDLINHFPENKQNHFQ